MDCNTIDVTNPETWLRRGRSPAEAAALAAAWQDYPDLPISAPADERMARTHARTIAMRPIFEAMRVRTEAERQSKNFAFVSGQIADGRASEQDKAIVRARDDYGYDWDRAVQFAQGWYAAIAGWNHRCTVAGRSDAHGALKAAYDHGFADGGGDISDLFDAARRANLAREDTSVRQSAPTSQSSGKLRPSQWPIPQDGHRPVSWERRIVILTELDLLPPLGRGNRPSRRPSALHLARERSAEALSILVLTRTGFVEAEDAVPCSHTITAAEAEILIADDAVRAQLKARLAARECDDLLVTAQGEFLRVLDALSDAFPVMRTMERTRNTPLQQRAHLEIWLARGRMPGQNLGAGHIRWSKASKGLTAKLGEFTARYAGPAAEWGHLIRVSLEDGSIADGFVTADHSPLAPEIRISSKARLRLEMAQALRAFGGATRLSERFPF
ncbi:hypothetical protein [Novosphingobium sp. JCM 18896]|uniref:hypothetical protein n=1 Tax=Novosphingobium sp. JCM 18896 TaxID=2989731 RepID=UPI0022233AFE|nr:hypothetical protein [Novosphingobium sp. JCM 18896]MCW1431996.1 hypothetical protein [Novosphingobium sp. JCM 18896]